MKAGLMTEFFINKKLDSHVEETFFKWKLDWRKNSL